MRLLLAAAAAALLTLTGCASAPEPADAFLEQVRAEMPADALAQAGEDWVLETGESLCEIAGAGDMTVSEVADAMRAESGDELGTLLPAIEDAAAAHLCPDAGSESAGR